MSSGGKGSSSTKSKNYYGTLSAPIGHGPIDWLNALVCNGNYIFQGSLTISSDVTDLTGSLADPNLIAPGGYLKLYRGTETQPANADLVGHPPKKGTAYLAAKHIFFGQDSGTAPNLQLIGGRIPRVPTAIVAAVDNVADDGQVNPVAMLAEILLHDGGAGVPQADLYAPSWLAAGHWCYLNRDFTFCSPSIIQAIDLRTLVKQLLEPFGAFCRRTPDNKLACMIYEWGVDPGGVPLFDARHWLKKPRFVPGDWSSIPTELMVNFVNRDFEYQNDAIQIPNARAAQIRQQEEPDSLQRPDLTRAAQAHRHGVEYLRRVNSAPGSYIGDIPQPFVDGLLVGDKVKVDTDPEPGGAGLAQMCRIEKIEQDASDRATLTLLTDGLLPAVPYTPGWTPTSPAADVSPPMVNFLAVPLPPATFGLPLAVGILATRPSAAVVGMEVSFSDDHSNPFDRLGQQLGFAVRATLTAGISDSDATISLAETDGLSAPDAGLAADTPGGNATAAENNTLLALLVSLDVNGRIALDGSGDPIMEFVSISDRTFVSGSTFSYSVLRGRLDTPALAWATSSLVWIFPRQNLIAWRHELLGRLAGVVAYFRLVSFTSTVFDDSVSVPECSVNMLPLTSPMYARGPAGSDGGELVANPDFSQGYVGWDTYLHWWDIANDLGEGGAPTWGAKPNVSVPFQLVNLRQFRVRPGERYAIRAKGIGVNGYVRITFFDKDDLEIYYFTSLKFRSVWGFRDADGAVPNGAVWARAEVLSDDGVTQVEVVKVTYIPPGVSYTSAEEISPPVLFDVPVDVGGGDREITLMTDDPAADIYYDDGSGPALYSGPFTVPAGTPVFVYSSLGGGLSDSERYRLVPP